MGRKILITSGKGGVGKTTIVAGLSKTLAAKNYSVCVVDGDMGLNNLDLIMGVEDKVVYDMADCIAGKCQIKQAIVKDEKMHNLFTMPASKKITQEVFSFSQILNKLASIFDFVLVDSPAGIDDGFLRASKPCCEAFVVVTPHISSIRDASKVLGILKSDQTKTNIKVVVNRIRGDLVASGEMINHKDIENLLMTELVGILPESDNYNIVGSFENLNIDSGFCEAFKILAQNVCEDKFIEYDYISEYKGFFGYFKRKLKRL